MKTRSYPWFAILSMFLILFLMPGLFQIHPRAGRGGSYRSGSSSSSRSSGSSYSGSSSSFSSHRYSGSSYSGSHSSSSSTSYVPVKTRDEVEHRINEVYAEQNYEKAMVLMSSRSLWADKINPDMGRSVR